VPVDLLGVRRSNAVISDPRPATGGRAVEASGDAGDWLMKTFKTGGEHGCSLAELGIGTNPGARLIGKVLEDEKALGAAHVAFGASQGIGGANAATVHIDGVTRDVRIELDDGALLSDGRLNLA
jgi:leucyl aminopeptidase (aminopeptidase T)